MGIFALLAISSFVVAELFIKFAWPKGWTTMPSLAWKSALRVVAVFPVVHSSGYVLAIVPFWTWIFFDRSMNDGYLAATPYAVLAMLVIFVWSRYLKRAKNGEKGGDRNGQE
ncbi:hypothetical protein H0E84_19185 [Luteimonas sp. SJ-92]|uniref:Uncharacterized protein n=1 Tax=Luteimonas salinisoli TaxID=2752307 RepID=A0A853JIG7_9GAMM|nr:hypothetical protein [Luteimonas salinisoli]NZA28502.1 hypothetical protein [Luteimonas salinisoli]